VSAMLGSLRRSDEHLLAAERVQAMTRERFALPADAPVLASEVACVVPGCPPRETVVAFWGADGTRYHFKVFKPLEQVSLDDLPFAWLRDSLAGGDGLACDCC
jgi:hypothetical protein